MTIQKYLHSCLVIEENGKRLLADPGRFCFLEGKIRPEDIGPVDAIILTHSHADHYFPDALRKIVALHDAPIIAHAEIGALLEKEKLPWQEIKTGESIECAGFVVNPREAPHERLPVPCPHNFAYCINEKVLLPGDSYSVVGLDSCEILALPVAGPWSRLADGIDFAKHLHPRIVIPIHDAIIKDFFLERIYDMCRTALHEVDIEFHPLEFGESFTV